MRLRDRSLCRAPRRSSPSARRGAHWNKSPAPIKRQAQSRFATRTPTRCFDFGSDHDPPSQGVFISVFSSRKEPAGRPSRTAHNALGDARCQRTDDEAVLTSARRARSVLGRTRGCTKRVAPKSGNALYVARPRPLINAHADHRSIPSRTAPPDGRAAAQRRRRRRLIRAILENAEESCFLSSRELARRHRVDPSTIVRTVQALGYEPVQRLLRRPPDPLVSLPTLIRSCRPARARISPSTIAFDRAFTRISNACARSNPA